MGFTKLDEGILQSSVMAADPVTFKVWIALLAACESDGVAPVAAPFLAAICHLPLDAVRRALEILAGPDPDSRTPEADGRRIQRCDGGWRLINYPKYRRLGLRVAESEARSERRHRPCPDTKADCPDPSASVSLSASGEKGGAGGGELPADMQAEADIRKARTRRERELYGLVGKIAKLSGKEPEDVMEHVTAFVRADGTRAPGYKRPELIRNDKRLENSVRDAQAWLADLEKSA